MAGYSEADYFTDQSLVEDPYPYFEYLRSLGPVVRLPKRNTIAVLGFDEGLAVHLDTDHFSAVNSVTGPIPPIPFIPEGDDITDQIEAHRSSMPLGEELLTQDPPRHSMLRSLLMRLFTPSRLRDMETHLTVLADHLLDEFVDEGRCEFISDYAAPYALLAIADLLGVPHSDRLAFRGMLGSKPSQIGSDEQTEFINPLEFRKERFVRYINDRRLAPRDDILSELANATYPDGSTPEAMDVVRAASLLFGAGQDTTATLLSACLRTIAEYPEIQGQLREKQELLPQFIDEILRIGGPVKATFRLVRKPAVIGDVAMVPGETVMIMTGAINRDPRRFSLPGEFQLGRKEAKGHLAFGRGAHTCPGAALARTEVRISLERILARCGDVRLDEAHHGPEGARHFAYSPSYIFRTLSELHLNFPPTNPSGSAR